MANVHGEEVDAELYPYTGATQSKVWSFFGFRKKGDGPPCKNNLQMDSVICKLCKMSYVNKDKLKFAVTCHGIIVLFYSC